MVHQLDVKSAYLNAPVEWKLYMEQAKGLEIENKNSNERQIYKLKKSLSGLKQAVENGTINYTYLIKQHFRQSLSDVCVYTKYKDEYTIIIVWVDDILIATKCNDNMIHIKNSLKQKFSMKTKVKLNIF